MSRLPRSTWLPRTGFGPICDCGWRTGLGVVLVTHHLTEVWELATRVAVLVDGRWAAR